MTTSRELRGPLIVQNYINIYSIVQNYIKLYSIVQNYIKINLELIIESEIVLIIISGKPDSFSSQHILSCRKCGQ